MKYVIMAAGKGTRWNNYLGIPKHLAIVDGETLLARTTRLLKENYISDFVITCHDARYAQYGPIAKQTKTECELDRFEETFLNEPVCYLYGDVYYTEDAIKTIINTDTDDVLFFGGDWEIFAIKVKNTKHFLEEKQKVKDLYLRGEINRCIGWEIYRSLHNLLIGNEYDYSRHIITDDYIKILDETFDFDTPEEYDEWMIKYRSE